jgi:hypothetical protein
LQHGQREAGGLAGAGLGGAKNVAAFEDDGDGLRLDGCGRAVALVRDSAAQLGGKAEAFERRTDSDLLIQPVRRLAVFGSGSGGKIFAGIFGAERALAKRVGVQTG